jgi:hypothetical protein
VRISPIDAGIRSDLDAALEPMRPLPDGLLDVYALSTEINSSRVEGIKPLTPLHASDQAASPAIVSEAGA